jgi:trk system potassium uptake protein TrkA
MLKQRVRKIMIIGGSRISYYLAKQLAESHLDIKIIEVDHERARELDEQLPEVAVINGDGTNQDLLREEGIDDVDAFLSLTGNDEENIILSLYAKTLNVSKVITKINHIAYYHILEKLDLGTIISPKAITANQILRFVRSLSDSITSEVKTLYKLVNNQIEAAEFFIPAETDYTGISFRDLPLKKDILIGCIVRDKTVIIPHGEDCFRAGDSVIIVSKQKLKDLEDILAGRP